MAYFVLTSLTPALYAAGETCCVSPSQVHIYELPDLKLLVSERLGGEVIPRSVLFASFEGMPYLLCALGDGQLYNFQVDSASGALR